MGFFTEFSIYTLQICIYCIYYVYTEEKGDINEINFEKQQ